MIGFRWIPIFILGACAGYGIALYFPPDKLESLVAQYKTGQSDQSLVEHPLPSKETPDLKVVAPKQNIASDVEPHASAESELRKVRSLMEAKAWSELVQLATKLISKDEAHRERLWPYLERAYIALIKSSLDQQAYEKARKYLVDADGQLGTSASRLILQAELNQLGGDLDAARTTLHQVITIDPSYGEMIYPLIRQVVIALITGPNASLAYQEKVQILTDEIINDPNFAEYYAILGRLHYQQGNYEEAVTNLNYALQLDHTQADELSPLVDAAQQRLHAPGLVEVPITSEGQIIKVDVRLNNAGRPFQFILDTGASFTAISSKTAKALGLSLSSNLPAIQISTANGIIRAPAVTLKAVNLKGALAENVQAVVLDDLSGYDGLLGLSFLNNFNIDINHAEGKLFISEH